MIRYSREMVLDALKDVCEKYHLTKIIHIQFIDYIKVKQRYLVILRDGTKHSIPQELINSYIESFGDHGGLEIAGNLRHDIALEESISGSGSPNPNEFWDGNMSDVIDYLNKKESEEKGRNG